MEERDYIKRMNWTSTVHWQGRELNPQPGSGPRNGGASPAGTSLGAATTHQLTVVVVMMAVAWIVVVVVEVVAFVTSAFPSA